MVSANPSLERGFADAVHGEPRSSTELSILAYRSRATVPLSELELYRLLRAAQARNRAEGLTGLLIYDHGCFLQWLEGPADGLARVWESIRRDVRHTAIDVLDRQQTQARVFPNWNLKLANRGAPRDGATRDCFDIAPDLLDGLRRRPEAASELLTKLTRVPVAAGSVPDLQTRAVLLGLVESVVIPGLALRHGVTWLGETALAVADPKVVELAHLLLQADPQAASALVRQLHAVAGSIEPMCATVFEPTARSLGDLWQADDCSEFDVTLGLCRLQTTLRQLDTGAARVAALGLPVVLVAPQPGEPHLLGAALDAELLWRAGWDMHTEFPATDAALEAMLAGTWFDALDLSLSAAFCREHWLPRLTETIAHARAASRNPALVVVVGGRVFGEQVDAGSRVGADASCVSSSQVEALILQALHKHG